MFIISVLVYITIIVFYGILFYLWMFNELSKIHVDTRGDLISVIIIGIVPFANLGVLFYASDTNMDKMKQWLNGELN